MSDRVWFTLAALVAVTMIGVSVVWPQGFGDRSPGPFGHAPVLPASTDKSNDGAAARAPLIGLDGIAQTPPSSEPELRPAQ